jgi:ribosomal protein S12 methylthiotransferase accessory factor
MRDNQRDCIGCLGSGLLFQRVQQHLTQEYQLLSLSKEDLPCLGLQCSMIVYCDDDWHFQTQLEINQQCLAMGIPWLRAYSEFGIGIVGPCVFPGETGCLLCVETRRQAAMTDASMFLQLRQAKDEDKQSRDHSWLASSSLEILAQLIVWEISAILQNPDKMRTHHAVLSLELETLRSDRHRFLPEPECTACGRLPLDTAEAAAITLQSRPKLGPSTYRTRSLTALAGPLFEEYVDTQMGLISSLLKSPDAAVASVVSQIGISDGERHRQMSGTGRSLSYGKSKLTAITEALERYGGQRPKGKRTGVCASYRQLGDQALDPTTLGLHTSEQYTLPGYHYHPYHRDLICRWVWGYSFLRQNPILVPEHVAYYGLRHHDTEEPNPAFVYEISNGCALGNCLEEAIFYGILEIAERDAFLMTWYAQLSLPRLDPLSTYDSTPGLLIENLERTSGYTISVFNSTLDHAIPCCWVMAVDEQDREGMPKALCGAGSHPNPEDALTNALLELAAMLTRSYDWFKGQRESALEMLVDPMKVQEMDHHSLLYFLPEAFERLHFLSQSRQQCTFQQAFGNIYRKPVRLDLRDDLKELVDYYLRLGIDVIVVDQTTAEQALLGLHCVKVIMPGMLPMTFGHQYRRYSGFQRLYQLPYQLGYRTSPLTDAEINPHPHPFP